MKRVTVTTDGSCLGNPGFGGWACILRCPAAEKELTGGEQHTTNNRMELMAVISALSALKERCSVQIVTDSEYVLKGMTEWVARWQSNGWRNSRRRAVENQDLWKRLLDLVGTHEVEWCWVKGHANNPDQNRCDGLARGAAQHQQELAKSRTALQVAS